MLIENVSYGELKDEDLEKVDGGGATLTFIAVVGAAYGAGYAIGKASYYFTHRK